MRTGFDNARYIALQTEKINERINQFSKLYIEFGGKLFDDFHAARVLPGFDVNGKARLLQNMKDTAEIIFCINAWDIENNKIRADFDITYDMDVLRLIDNLRKMDLYINCVLINRFEGQPSARTFQKRLESRGVRTYVHGPTSGYPNDIDVIVSDEGYGQNPYIETTRPLVVVTGPGPGSGKLATCLSQLYHEYKRGISAGYAKFETFPIWNLPLKHPVNLAYEAATADINDVNMIDPFHLEAYGTTAVNYNRDIDAFPIVRTILSKITGNPSYYQSPTDMGVNMAGNSIVDDEVVCAAARQEIIRRYYKASCDVKQGKGDVSALQKIKMLMKQLDLTPANRPVCVAATERAEKTGLPVVAIELPDGQIVSGKAGSLLNAPSAALINAIKKLSGMPDELLLLSPVVLEPILRLKKHSLGSSKPSMNLKDTLIALSICAATNSMVERALEMLSQLRHCEAHASYIVKAEDAKVLRQLTVELTCEPQYPTDNLYYV